MQPNPPEQASPGPLHPGRLLMLAGLAAILAAIMPAAREALGIDGGKAAWFISVVGLAVFALGYCTSRAAMLYGATIAALFTGGAAQLWLTQPLWFPALRFHLATPADFLMAALVAGQAVFALALLARQGVGGGLARLLKVFGPVRLILFLGLSTAFSVSVMGYLPRGFVTSYVLHLVAAGGLIGINLLTVIALLRIPPPFDENRLLNPLLPAGVALLASAGLAWFAFDRIPHVEDEVAYLFQARTYAGGALSVPAPPEGVRDGLEYYLLDIVGDRWMSVSAPGWPAALTLATLAGQPWLLNPLLAALAVLLAHAVASRLVSRPQADIVALLVACSPWLLGASGALMPHTLALALTLLAWWLLLRQRDTGQAGWPVLVAGLAMGWLFVTRQLEGVLIGTLTGMWLLSRWRQPGAVATVLVYSAGCIAAGSLYLWYNFAITGDPLTPILEEYLNKYWHTGANSYGFGPGIGPDGGWGDLDMAMGHSPLEGVLNALHNMSALHLEFLGYGVGSLALVWCLLLWGRIAPHDLAMSAIVVVIISSMFFYWFSGGYYLGPRYWFSTLFPLAMLSASGYGALADRLEALGLDRAALPNLLIIMCIFAVLVFTPWRGVTKYHEYGGYTSEIRDFARSADVDGKVVIFSTAADPGSGLFLNDPWLRPDRPLFLKATDDTQADRAAAAFPDRPILHYPDAP